MEKVVGVNLGGWLILERWMTPSLFNGLEARDEKSLVAELGIEVARKRLEEHRQSFITEETIAALRRAGITSLRVPVPYWLFADEDGFVGGGFVYLDSLFDWARRFGMQVIVDIHAVPGSQNGYDHSGCIGDICWGREDTITRSLDFLALLCARYGQLDELRGIEMMNEPSKTLSDDEVTYYYKVAGKIVADMCHDGVLQIMSDSYEPLKMARLLASLNLERPCMDMHMYQLFSEADRRLSLRGHVLKAWYWAFLIAWISRIIPVMVGEWSVAMDESYQPRTRPPRKFERRDYARFAAAQRWAFMRARYGAHYWTAKIEDGSIWSFLDTTELISR